MATKKKETATKPKKTAAVPMEVTEGGSMPETATETDAPITEGEAEVSATQEKVDLGLPIDVFLCIADSDHIEEKKAVIEEWQKYEEAGKVRLFLIAPDGADTPWHDDTTTIGPLETDGDAVAEFQRSRRWFAELSAESDIYVVADSDCIPIGASFVDRAVAFLKDKRYLEFGMLSAIPVNANIYPWTPEKEGEFAGYDVYDDPRVIEHVNVGGIRFIKKGVMGGDVDEWRQQAPAGADGKYRYDQHHAEQMREKGFRVGYIKSVMMRHLGEGR